ncbi:MAG: RnfABCDGE type electron transport complex subunit G [Lentisphaerae bacterium]|jgi:electron transport complex protein RnfG|nr:RnfABCDGE type electron transport complex subunit G [Lentisphaerota bacterium]
MKDIVKLVVILALISAICTAILAAVNSVTREPIAQSKARRILEAAQKVLPEGATPKAVTVVIADQTNTCYVSRDPNGVINGVAIQGSCPKGYSGNITVMFGLVNDTLYNYEVIEHSETPGLGAKIKDEPFRTSLTRDSSGKPRSLSNTKWKVAKDGGDITAITAATISSRATLGALENALANYNAIKDSIVSESE